MASHDRPEVGQSQTKCKKVKIIVYICVSPGQVSTPPTRGDFVPSSQSSCILAPCHDPSEVPLLNSLLWPRSHRPRTIAYNESVSGCYVVLCSVQLCS